MSEKQKCDRCHNDKGVKWRGIPDPLCEDCLVWMIDDDMRDFR